MMDWVIGIGVLLTLEGLVLIVSAMFRAMKLRKADMPEPEMREALARLGPRNFGGLALSALGLIMVIVGLVLS